MDSTSEGSAYLDFNRVWAKRKRNFKNYSLGSVVKVELLWELGEAVLPGEENYEQVNEPSLSQSVINTESQ